MKINRPSGDGFSYEAPCQEIISGIKDQKRFELPFLIRAFIRIVPFGTQKELCHFLPPPEVAKPPPQNSVVTQSISSFLDTQAPHYYSQPPCHGGNCR
jgi:hypothetical protein